MPTPLSDFTHKVQRLGLDTLGTREFSTLFDVSLETLALVLPEQAFVFRQMVMEGHDERTVERALGRSERTIRRLLHGTEQELGADRWLLVLMALYRDAMLVPQGLETLYELTTPRVAGAGGLLGVPFHRGLLVALVEAFVGTDLSGLLSCFPWSKGFDSESCRIAWPCVEHVGRSRPLATSRLSGLMQLLSPRHEEDLPLLGPLLLGIRYHLVDEEKCLATRRGPWQRPTTDIAWDRFLTVVHNGALLAAESAIVDGSAERDGVMLAARGLLERHGTRRRYAIAGLLLRSTMLREVVVQHPALQRLGRLQPPADLRYCFEHCYAIEEALR